MNRDKTLGVRPMDYFEIADSLLTTTPQFPDTSELAADIADLVAGQRFLVRYDEMTAPLIDAAFRKNDEESENTIEYIISKLQRGLHVIVFDEQGQPPVLGDISGEASGSIGVMDYMECVRWAVHELWGLLNSDRFDFSRYMLYVGSAWALTKTDHPDWGYRAFMEQFRKDVVTAISTWYD